MQPNGPGSSIAGADRPMRAKLRKSPPSVTTIASGPIASCSAASTRLGCSLPSAAGRRAGHGLAQLAGPLLVARAQLRRPVAIDRGRAVAGGLDQRPQRLLRRREHLDGAAPVVPQLGRDVGDAHELRRAEHRRRAVRELEVEPAADGQHDVGVAHHRPAHGADHRRVRVRHQAAALAGVEIDRAEPVQQRHQLRPGAARAAPGDHQHPARRPQQLDGRGHLRRVRQRAPGAAWAACARPAARLAAPGCAACRRGSRCRTGRARRPRRRRARSPRRARPAPASARARSGHSG